MRNPFAGIMAVSVLVCSLSIAEEEWIVTTVAENPEIGVIVPGELFVDDDGSVYSSFAASITSPDGAICRVSPNGAFETVCVFDGAIGASPFLGPLIKGTDGCLWGTAAYGGEGYSGPFTGFGTIFRIVAGDQVELMFAFSGTNGAHPVSGVVQGIDGCFYGTTAQGGPNTSYSGGADPAGLGTIFKLETNGVLTTLAVFDGTNGWNPRGLVQASDGALFGVTYRGGTHNLGTVFRLTPEGDFTVLHSFSGTNGAHPQARLIAAVDGHLYGTTEQGGESQDANWLGGNGYGTVFRITLAGELTTLVSFNNQNGAFPRGALIETTNGVFWGTTYMGESNWGTVFEINQDGQMRTMALAEPPWGLPTSGLVRDSYDRYYGSAQSGVIYCLRRREPPVVQCHVENGEVTVAWDAWGSRLYKIECKDSLEDEWTTLDWVRPEWNSRCSHKESVESNVSRFYRVILDPTLEETTWPVED